MCLNVSALSRICIHEFTIVYSAAWRTYKQAGHHVLCVCLPQCVCVGFYSIGWIQQGLSTVSVCYVCYSIQQSCELYLSFSVCCAGANLSVPTCRSPICCSTATPSMTHPFSPLWKHNHPVRLSFLPSSTTRHLSPLVTIYSPAQPSFVFPIQPHLHPLSHFPKPKITFF